MSVSVFAESYSLSKREVFPTCVPLLWPFWLLQFTSIGAEFVFATNACRSEVDHKSLCMYDERGTHDGRPAFRRATGGTWLFYHGCEVVREVSA